MNSFIYVGMGIPCQEESDVYWSPLNQGQGSVHTVTYPVTGHINGAYHDYQMCTSNV